MTSTSNGESAKNDIEKETIFEFIEINGTGNIDTIGEGESVEASFDVSDAQLLDSEADETELTKTSSFEVTTQLDNETFITFTLEVEYELEDDNSSEFSIDNLLEDSSFIDELTVTDSKIATDTDIS
ncbi:MAG: hypothetical protein AAFV71_29065 [Cyanobacteria bacterium J06633_8]